MKFSLKFSLIAVGLLVIFVGLAGSRSFAPAGNNISLVSPSACPPSGCAAGQRLNFKVDFSLLVYDPAKIRNVQVCVYAPIDWSVTAYAADLTGGVTGSAYSTGASACDSTPANYDLLGGAYTTLSAGAFGDSISFAFRLGNTASTAGSVLVRVLERTAANTWVRTSQIFSSLTVTGTSTSVFVATDANACLSFSPCYINSGDDLSSGYGTGLKDAIDSSSSAITIKILGSYYVKTSAVLIDHPHTITGVNNARINFTGDICSEPLLRLAGGVTLTNLAISPGACSDSSRRTLLQLENTFPVSIESNDLTGGLDAIRATGASSGKISVRYNAIQANTGYAIILDPAGTSTLEAVANNISANRSGAEVDCGAAARGTVDHNFWGAKDLATAVSKCTSTENKRLGAAVLAVPGVPGVSAQKVSVSSGLTFAFNDKIGYQFSAASGTTGTNFDLFIVNHGVGSAQNIPFTGSQAGGLAACSNYWDVFLASATPPPAGITLQLAFKYNLSSSCISTIESTRFCSQTTNPEAYPLYWYETGASTWATTGQTPGGQTTSCNSAGKFIQVSINDAGGRPSFSDLAYTPFVVGLPNQPAAVVFSSFSAEPGNQKAILHWATTSEINTNGFIVLRSEQVDSGYTEVSPLIPHSGTSQSGFVYTYTDTSSLVNGRVYYYRLKVMNLDLTSIQTGSVSVTPIPETPTPTPTPTITPTVTLTDIPTRTRTFFPTSTYIFRSITPSRTLTYTPTSSFQTVTNTRTVTVSVTPTKASSNPPLVIVTPEAGAATQLAQQRLTRTAQVTQTTTSTSSPTPNGAAGGEAGGLSLTAVLLITALLAAGAGAAVYFFKGRQPDLT